MPVSSGFGTAGIPGTTLKAWVRFDGAGVVIAQYNVASVVRTGAGAYQVNFTTAMSTANYVGRATLGKGSAGAVALLPLMNGATTAQAAVGAASPAGVLSDSVMAWEFYE